tara:strand:- start:196 stop:636 length:441 start_codon:yes stop_codon:yes gene_type:complete
MFALIPDDDAFSKMEADDASSIMEDDDHEPLAPLPKAQRLTTPEHLEQQEMLKQLQVKVEQLQQLLDQTMKQLGKTEDQSSPEADTLRAEIAKHSASIRAATYGFMRDLRQQMESKIPAPERVSGRPRRPLSPQHLEFILRSYFDR